MQHFFPDDEFKSRNSRLTIQAFLVFAGLGAYKLIAAVFYNGYTNVFGIVFITFIGLFILAATAKMPRLTKLGETHLKRLQIAFERIKPSNHYPISEQPQSSGTMVAIDPFLLSVGVFGGAALAGTIYSDYNQAFQRAQNQSAISPSSCGSGCGSSSCSSGGDGGGGGCGGCGGGCS